MDTVLNDNSKTFASIPYTNTDLPCVLLMESCEDPSKHHSSGSSWANQHGKDFFLMLCSTETLLQECSQYSRLDAPLKHRQRASQITLQKT